MGLNLWIEMVTDASPLVDEGLAEIMFYRAATAWGSDQQLEVSNGMGGWVDLTKLFEQYKIIETLKGDHNAKEKS